MRARRAGLALAAALAAGLASAAEVQEAALAAFTAFLEGRLEDSASGYRYLATLGIQRPDPDANQAVIARDRGRHDEALPLWIKATLRDGADGFSWNQRAWSSLSLDQTREAREAFLQAIDRSSTTASQAEAYLGLGLAALADGQPKAAMAPLRSALIQGPYLIPAASYQTALTALRLRDRSAAMAYLRQSVELEPFGLEALEQYARQTEESGENRSAWRLYHRLLTLDPSHEQARDRLAKLSRFITGDPESALATRRLGRPLLDAGGKGSPEPGVSSETLRVAIFSDQDGDPQTATRAYFMANSDFQILAASGEIVKFDGRGFEQWEIMYRSETGVVEVRDGSRNIQYTSRQPFTVVPQSGRGSVLVKSAKFEHTRGFDPGDRELRGSLEVQPNPRGFKIVNELRLEDYLLGAVGAAMPPSTPAQAYKVQAIVSRTLALWHKRAGRPNLERTHLCDSAHCQRYVGVHEEMREAGRGVAETEGVVLARDGRLAHAMHHENCGGRTESGEALGEPGHKDFVGVDDSPTPSLAPRTPEQLERWTHEFPPRDAFCEASGLTPQVQSRWLRVLPAEDLKRRAARIKDIGSIKHLRVARRTPSGRATAVELVGSRDTLRLEGAKAIASVLSPGSLRSMLFTIQPLMSGSKAARFLLWGAGTGHGLGLCKAGALGQAASGRDHKAILAHYYPRYELDNHLRARPASAPAPSGLRKPKNPRFQKKDAR